MLVQNADVHSALLMMRDATSAGLAEYFRNRFRVDVSPHAICGHLRQLEKRRLAERVGESENRFQLWRAIG